MFGGEYTLVSISIAMAQYVILPSPYLIPSFCTILSALNNDKPNDDDVVSFIFFVSRCSNISNPMGISSQY